MLDFTGTASQIGMIPVSNIKMVAVDMDGTFVRSDQTFDEERFKRILARMKDAWQLLAT